MNACHMAATSDCHKLQQLTLPLSGVWRWTNELELVIHPCSSVHNEQAVMHVMLLVRCLVWSVEAALGTIREGRFPCSAGLDDSSAVV